MEDGDLLTNATVLDLGQQWMLAAHPGAFTDAHIDGGGYCTWVKCLTGSKVWMIARRQGGDDIQPERDGGFNTDDCDWLMVLLLEGDEL